MDINKDCFWTLIEYEKGFFWRCLTCKKVREAPGPKYPPPDCK